MISSTIIPGVPTDDLKQSSGRFKRTSYRMIWPPSTRKNLLFKIDKLETCYKTDWDIYTLLVQVKNVLRKALPLLAAVATYATCGQS